MRSPGTPFRASLRFVAASPTRFPSSPGAIRSFCNRCGTSLTFESDDHPDESDVTIASLDEPGRVVPKDHTHVAVRTAWDVLCDGLPTLPEGRPAGT